MKNVVTLTVDVTGENEELATQAQSPIQVGRHTAHPGSVPYFRQTGSVPEQKAGGINILLIE